MDQRFPQRRGILNGFNQADIDSRIKGYTVQQRNGLYDAADGNGSAAVRIRAPIDLGRAIEARNWAAAARVLDAYPEIATRVPGQLRGMGWREDVHLLAAADSAHLAIAGQMRSVVGERRPTSCRPAGADGRLELVRRRGDAQRAHDPDSAAAIERLTASQLFDINEAATTEGLAHVTTEFAAEPQAGLIKVEGFDRRLRDALKREDWVVAVVTLADVRRRRCP